MAHPSGSAGFSILPAEIRCQIWRWAVSRRVIRVGFNDESRCQIIRFSAFSFTPSKYPTVPRICHESRYEALRFYTWLRPMTLTYCCRCPSILFSRFDILYLATPPVGYGLFALRYPASRMISAIAIDMTDNWAYELEMLFSYPDIRFEKIADLYFVSTSKDNSPTKKQGLQFSLTSGSEEEDLFHQLVAEKIRGLDVLKHVPDIYFRQLRGQDG
ncbi:hypothetical protein F5Y02DRAFT_423909 [Annulohypoxylon stygium]|nr:hypothetical protein F5Y02DRAFT_423909 [Annulohypoxylon stygium]